MTVEEFFRTTQSERPPVDVALENDLPDLFVRKGRRRAIRPAWELVREHGPAVVNKIEYWTGARRSVIRSLIDGIEETAQRLDLYVDTRAQQVTLVELTAYATTLAMNYLTLGSFVPRRELPLGRARRRLPRRPG